MRNRIHLILVVSLLSGVAMSCRNHQGSATPAAAVPTATSVFEPTDQIGGLEGVSLTPDGEIYVTDWTNCRIWRVDIAPPQAIAGGRGLCGPPKDGVAARYSDLWSPTGLAIGKAGEIYFNSGCAIYEILNDVISTVPGTGTCDGVSPRGNGFVGMAADREGALYFAVWAPSCVVNRLSGGVITTIAGTGACGSTPRSGPADQVPLHTVAGIAVDDAGDVFLVDDSTCRVLKLSQGMISTIAGTGVCGFSGDGGAALSATLKSPKGIAVERSGQRIYVADTDNYRIRVIEGGTIRTIAGTGKPGVAGSGGDALRAELRAPFGLAVNDQNEVFIAEFSSCRLLKIAGGLLTTVASATRCVERDE